MTLARGYDTWRVSGRYRSEPVEITCTKCGNEWSGRYCEEFGTGWLEPREGCEKCGAIGDDLTTTDSEGP